MTTDIREPAWFARQLGWTHGIGWSGGWSIWTWTRLCDVAAKTYWLNRAPVTTKDAA